MLLNVAAHNVSIQNVNVNVLELLRCVQPRSVTLRHVTFT
jgi:hypothetical protein